MTPPATAAARSEARTAVRRPARPAGPRRISGPPRERRDPRAAAKTRISAGAGMAPRSHVRTRGLGSTGVLVGAGALALPGKGIRAAARTLPDGGGLIDRVLRGRAIIGVVAALLIGLVFLQVSLLKLNAGIGAAVQTSSTYELQNQTLRSQISALQEDGRITLAAEKLGMVMPRADQVRYLRAARAGGVGGAGGVALSPQEQAAYDGTSGSTDTSDDASATADDTSASTDGSTDDTSAAVDDGSSDPSASTDDGSGDTSADTSGGSDTSGQSAAADDGSGDTSGQDTASVGAPDTQTGGGDVAPQG